jgi:O-succinylhomoserine sulfhydrylase
MAEKRKFETEAIRGQIERTQYREHSVPMYPTSSFVFESAEQGRALFAGEEEGLVYSRYGNPNTGEFVNKLAALEGLPTGIATASGMAAVFLSIAAFVERGDHIVASRSLFGSTHQLFSQLFPKWGVTASYVDATDTKGFEEAVQENTRMLFAESPSNPGLDIVDLGALGEIARRHSLIFNVDNCFATPYLQRPAELGAHVVTHSATKFIDGQGRVLGGAVLGSEELIEKAMFLSRHTGPALSPFNAWLLSKSLETLAVRMEAHCRNAQALAERLTENPNINWVKYPFLDSHPQHELARQQMKLGGGLLTFEVKGGLEEGKRFLDGLEMLSLSSNLGDTRSIATHPSSTTHSKLSEEERQAVGITPGLVRISAGLEHIDDIIADVEAALAQAAG